MTAAEGDTAVVCPMDIAEASRLVRFARDHEINLVPTGGGTKRHWIGPSEGRTIAMDMRRLSRVVEYAPNDMTIEVEAGITLAALQETLAKNGQRLPLDPPDAGRATIGGILAANDNGPIRFANGTARDLVIGMSFIEPDGEIARSGGRVVKNVAGYDLHKLYIGSFGTLGPIATVTFKLRPVPASRRLILIHPSGAADAERIIAGLLAGATRPAILDLLNGRAATAMGWDSRLTLIVGFEENAEATAWQCDQVLGEFGGQAHDETASATLYETLCAATGGFFETGFKATMLSSQVSAFVELASEYPLRIVARAGNGVAHGICEASMDQNAWRRLIEAAVAGRGNLQIRGQTPKGLQRIGSPRRDAFLSDAVRKAFDPTNMFAPQRLA